MSQPPAPDGAVPAPPGTTVQHGESVNGMRQALLAAYVVMIAVPSVLVALRIFVQLHLNKVWRMADTVCMLAWCFTVAQTGLTMSLLRLGVGEDAWNLSPDASSDFAKRVSVCDIVYLFAVYFTKTAIALQLYQIFGEKVDRRRLWMLIGFVLFNTLYGLVLLFIEIFKCSNSWRQVRCKETKALFYMSASLNFFCNVILLLLPVLWIWRLRMSLKKKICITGLFAIGIVDCVCSIMRLVVIVNNGTDANITRSLTPVALWSTAEISCSLIVCCLPVLPRLLPASQRNISSPFTGHFGNKAPSRPGIRGVFISDQSLLRSRELPTQTSISALSSARESKYNVEFSEANGDDAGHGLTGVESAITRSVESNATMESV